MTKTAKRILSILLHLIILVGMVALYDAGFALWSNMKEEEVAEEATEEKSKEPAQQETTMDDLMAQKQKKEKAKPKED